MKLSGLFQDTERSLKKKPEEIQTEIHTNKYYTSSTTTVENPTILLYLILIIIQKNKKKLFKI